MGTTDAWLPNGADTSKFNKFWPDAALTFDSLFYQDKKRLAEQLLAGIQASEEELATRNGTENPRAHAALGDLIMHRAQFLFNEGRYDESEKAIQSWKRVSDSTYEKRTELDLDTALDKVRVACGKVDEAVGHLKEVVERGRPGSASQTLKPSDVNWATVILCQVYCFQGQYQNAISELQPRVDALISSNSQAEFITSDFRILFCEALIGLKNFNDAERELDLLCRDLRLPTQVENPRASTQLFSAMRMIARCYQLQHQWEKAAKAWIDALAHEQVTPARILTGNFEKKYYVLVTIYSLGIVRWNQGDKNLGQQYIDIAKADSGALTYPSGKTDYTGWLAYVEGQYHTLDAANHSSMFRRFFTISGI
jgi:tetratricopeptide (TPR) repeat protein